MFFLSCWVTWGKLMKDFFFSSSISFSSNMFVLQVSANDILFIPFLSSSCLKAIERRREGCCAVSNGGIERILWLLTLYCCFVCSKKNQHLFLICSNQSDLSLCVCGRQNSVNIIFEGSISVRYAVRFFLKPM